MLIDVRCSAGPVPTPRRVLATAIVLETLSRFGDRIVRVRFDVPDVERGPDKMCLLYVLLDDGAVLEARAAGTCVADVMESAAHTMRRRIAAALGVPLCERQREEQGDPRAERRAS
jgi:hypothetical protein